MNRTARPAAFAALLFTALALVPSGAHLAELPNKIGLPMSEYLTVQQIYRAWALFGIVIAGAIASMVALTVKLRRVRRSFGLALLALLCLVGSQVVFWTFTFPANQVTDNWTVLPLNWTDVRTRWEYSHDAAAGLNLTAFIALALACLHIPDSAR